MRAQAPPTRRQSEQRAGIKAPGSARTEEEAAHMWGGAQSGQRAAGSTEEGAAAYCQAADGIGVNDRCKV